MTAGQVRTVWQVLREQMDDTNDPTAAVEAVAAMPARLLKEYVRQLALPVARSMVRAHVRRIEQEVRGAVDHASPRTDPLLAESAPTTNEAATPMRGASSGHSVPWHRLFGERLVIPGEGIVTTWERATADQLRQRAAWLRGQAMANIQTADLCDQAADELEAAGASCLAALYGTEAAA
jgi:hypothetical protein